MSRESLFLPHVTADPFVVQQMIERLHDRNTGVPATKVSHRGVSDTKAFFLDELESRFYYTPSLKGINTSSFPFQDIHKIESAIPKSLNYRPKGDEKEMYPAYVELKSTRSVLILFDTEKTRYDFVQTIAFLARRSQSCYDEDPHKLKCYDLWMKADANGDKVLKFSEVEAVAFELNVGLSPATLLKEFERFDVDRNENLNYAEFVEFFNYLTARPEMKPLFDLVAEKGENEGDERMLTDKGMQTFLKDIQGEDVHIEVCRKIIRNYCTDREAVTLSYREFCDFLLDSGKNGWSNLHHAKVYQDMTQPLHHYWINSSHNTYLTGDQLQSKSSCDMYRTALLAGCRCVELDCWDGSGDDPVIYHGYTRTSKILFRDVISAIKETAFVNSEFPVILSLEVHTSEPQRDVMAAVMKSQFGSMLYTYADAERDEHKKWSPAALKRKILVKWKLTDDGFDDEKENDNEDIAKRKKAQKEEDKKKANSKKKKSSSNNGQLGRTVMVAAIHSDNWGEDAQGYNITSIAEGKTMTICEKDSDKFRSMNTKMLTRIYPKGTRIDSSNYDPTIPWEQGSQCVALNFQTWDENLRLNESKFLDNGRCGYILKPLCLRDASAPRSTVNYTLKVTVILAVQLPKVGGESEIIDPYVKVILRGSAKDNKANPAKKTKVIDDNGFSPFWNETFEFTITDLDCALLTLRVMDKDLISDDEVGEATVSLKSLKLGYRAVQLFSMTNPTALQGSKLLCHFSLDSDAPTPEPEPEPEAEAEEEPVAAAVVEENKQEEKSAGAAPQKSEEPKAAATTASQKPAIDWAALHAKLPTKKVPEEKAKRKELFKQFDPNGNGYLSLAEVDRGCEDVLGLHALFEAKPVIMRAFQTAKDVNTKRNKPGSKGPDYVEFCEFRLLLVYLGKYFELWQMFEEIDTSNDRRVELAEFKHAIPKLEGWGVKITDPEASFKEIDTDGGGMILFDEFAHWALAKGLDLEEDEDDS